jgi:hypothetical protein
MRVTYDLRASEVRPNLTNWEGISQNSQLVLLPWTCLFLFHQFGVGAIIDNILAKDRSGQWSVYLLGIDVLQLSIEDKFVALCPEADSGFFSEKNEGEDIAILRPSQSSAFQTKLEA